MNDWYREVPATDPLEQGDIFLGCPLLMPSAEIDYRSLADPAQIKGSIQFKDVIVLTQSCDLDEERDHTENVVLCPIATLKDVSKKELSNLVRNKVTDLHIINKCDGNLPLDYRIVDFGTIYTIPYPLLVNWKNTLGPRLRLNTPYRELMAQRFGLQFMRIGFDDEFKIDEKDAKARHEKLNSK